MYAQVWFWRPEDTSSDGAPTYFLFVWFGLVLEIGFLADLDLPCKLDWLALVHLLELGL